VVLGTVLGGWAGWRFRRVRRGIDEGRFEPPLNVAGMVTATIVIGGLLIVGLIVWRVLIQGAHG